MTKREQVLKNAEAFVKTVVEHDFKQHVDAETLRAAALKASRAIPQRRDVKRHSTPSRRELVGTE